MAIPFIHTLFLYIGPALIGRQFIVLLPKSGGANCLTSEKNIYTIWGVF